MTATQEIITDTTRRSQDAMEMWADTVKKMFGSMPTPDGKMHNAAQFMDNYFDVYFDYAEHLLATQRDFAKSLMSVTTSAATKTEAAVQDVAKDVQESTKDMHKDMQEPARNTAAKKS